MQGWTDSQSSLVMGLTDISLPYGPDANYYANPYYVIGIKFTRLQELRPRVRRDLKFSANDVFSC